MKKVADAIVYCKKELLTFLQENLQQTTQSISQTIGAGKNYEQFELSTLWDRIISQSLLSIGFIIETLSDEENQKWLNDWKSLIETTKILSFWNSKSSMVKRACFSLFTTISKKLPGLKFY